MGKQKLKRYGFRLGSEYFYPASAVKLCAAVAAVRSLRSLGTKVTTPISLTTPMVFHVPSRLSVSKEALDTSNLRNGAITVAHEIRKLFLVSDNRAFNRLYEFVGQRSLNEQMWQCGMLSLRIRHRLYDAVPRLEVDERLTPALEFWNSDSDAVGLPPQRSTLDLDLEPGGRITVGSAFISSTGALVDEPLDFTNKNSSSLMDLQNLLVKIFYPNLLEGERLDLDEQDARFLMEAMAQYPSQSSNPKYPAKKYPDEYGKFFLPGLLRVRDKSALRIYNKLGRAYGFSIDNAYVTDIESGRSFFLSAVIYTNANDVLNDDKYEYKIADAFLENLAEVVSVELWGKS
ncbi:hypothetical protein CYMTET_19720 [Cymbomonas tetramitiformis]|uniref:Beta-lactamase class A catalytic domain-containing protein n=1 Tax=Cymbomonas tetramitiformis TaxID=36881 RepID=A0AAE0G611_9CHLO|nr:hypothetical protein CYMTET_19720 [Cymbomonas tetramitiformis]